MGYSSVSFYAWGCGVYVMQKTILSAGIILICSSRVWTWSSDSNKIELEFSPFKLEQISQSFKQNFDRSLLGTPKTSSIIRAVRVVHGFGHGILGQRGPFYCLSGFIAKGHIGNTIQECMGNIWGINSREYIPSSRF